MSAGRDARVASLRRLVDVARALVDAGGASRAPLVRDIAAATGLSVPNVELGLDRHLELSATPAELEALVRGARDACMVHVILSANVFVAPLRALLLARASTDRVTVRPSPRDPVLARAIVQAFADPSVALDEARDPSRVPDGEIHVYGRDETIRAVRAAARTGVRVVGHGAGLGVALAFAPDLPDLAAAIAEDVVPFDQRGCLSPRVVLVRGDAAAAERFGEQLSRALGALEARIPRGALTDDERAAARRWRDTLAFAGRVVEGSAHAVGVGPLGVPPPGRHVHVTPVQGAPEAAEALAPIAPWVVALGSDDLAAARAVAPAHARLSALGRMQRPPLDGPVDRRA